MVKNIFLTFYVTRDLFTYAPASMQCALIFHISAYI
jgi:hypothetical protein